MRVLLVSPLDPDIPGNLKFLMGGENTYTRTLLANPPAGVEYVHHLQALEQGEIRFGALQLPLRLLVKLRLLPLSAGTIDISVLGKFDMIHCHGYTLRLSGPCSRIPVVMGDSVPTRWALGAYFNQHPFRICATYALRRFVHSAGGVYDQDLSLGAFSTLLVMSEFAKREHEKLGMGPERIAVTYPGLPDRGVRKGNNGGPIRILFAGVWFERKGGTVLWEAYLRLRRNIGDKVRLMILGPVPEKLSGQRTAFRVLGITQQDFVPYDRLVGEFYPAADILVHVPPKAEGYGLVVEEAMSFGIPAVVSKIGALPEMVLDGKTGFVIEPGSVGALVVALERLIGNASLRERMGKEARARFLRKFSLPVTGRQLLAVYRNALEKGRRL